MGRRTSSTRTSASEASFASDSSRPVAVRIGLNIALFRHERYCAASFRVHMQERPFVHSPRASRTSRLAIPLTEPSDYHLHKQPDRHQLYSREGGLWWSDQLQRWMVSNPALIAEVLRSSAFAGHSYDVSAIMHRFSIDLHHLQQLSQQFPLAFEGERHRTLRKRFSAEIAAQHGLRAHRVRAGDHGAC